MKFCKNHLHVKVFYKYARHPRGVLLVCGNTHQTGSIRGTSDSTEVSTESSTDFFVVVK